MRNFDQSEEHGGIDPQELKSLGISAEQLVDFSVNSNPFGPAPNVREALSAVDISAYPDQQCGQLRAMLAAHNHTSEQEILVGNGTAEIIWLAAQAFLQPGDEVMVIGPTFTEYRRAAEGVGAHVLEVRAQPPNFQPPLDEVREVLRKKQPRMIFLCNPNNPSGKYLPVEKVHEFLMNVPEGTLLVLDEAYRAFMDSVFFGALPAENCIVLRSMTKDFALAGLRLGYVLASAGSIRQIQHFQPAWSVNAMAQAAGCTVLKELAYYCETLHELMHLKIGFFSGIREAGYTVVDSQTHFGLLHCARPAREIRKQLLHRGVQVRDCASFGLPNYIRVSTRLPEENQLLLDALRQIKIEMGSESPLMEKNK